MEMCAAKLKQASTTCNLYLVLWELCCNKRAMYDVIWMCDYRSCLSCYRHVTMKCKGEGFSCPVF